MFNKRLLFIIEMSDLGKGVGNAFSDFAGDLEFFRLRIC